MCGERTKEQVQANQVQDKNKQAGGFPLALYLSCHVILEEHKAAETEEFEEYRRRCHLETEHQACHAWSILSDCLSLSLSLPLYKIFNYIYIFM